MPNRLLVLGFLALVLLLATVGSAQTLVSGSVSGTWTAAGNPYVVTDTLRVEVGESLLLRPGVEVLFAGPFPLQVYGRLCAAGAEGDSITFAPQPSGNRWRGIHFLGAADGSYLQYCHIRESEALGSAPTDGGGAIRSLDSSPVIAHCLIQDCRAEHDQSNWERFGGGAIFCQGGSPQILFNRIQDCTASTICLSGGGGIWFLNSNVQIQHNEILNCQAHGMGGALGGCWSTVTISHNVIAYCSGFHYGGGIALREGCTGQIDDNLIVHNVCEDTYGGGIYLYQSSAEITCCTVAFNSVGVPGWGEGGGVWMSETASSGIENCIFWGNTAFEGPQIYPAGMYIVNYCDVQGGYGGGSGNFNLDPRFATGSGTGVANDFFLSAVAAGQSANSPCLNAGNCSASEAGLDQRSTRTDLVPDAGPVDLGFHQEVAEVTAIPVVERASGPVTVTRVTLEPNHPNPFNPQTTIRFHLPEQQRVRLTVCDLRGNQVAELLHAVLPAGNHEVLWRGRDAGGRALAAGTYLVNLDAGGDSSTRSMTLVK